MHCVTIILSAVTLFYFLNNRLAIGDDCLTTQTDPGALYLKQLQQLIDSADCQLVGDITYTDYQVSDYESYDFIIVGAGSAGSVMANRLSENPDCKVLLLEAGGDPTISTEVPALFATTLNTNLDWQYRTEPEPTNCLGMVDRRCNWPRGKVIGGSSTINAMLYVRGNPKDYDEWERMGNPGWNYRNMLPYFKKSEGFRSDAVPHDKEFFTYHNTTGLLKIESFQYNIPFLPQTISQGFKQLGYQKFSDVNGQHHEGVFTVQGTLENARRCSAAKAFLHNFQSRSNLNISKNSYVKKVLVNENKTAYGVEFIKEGKTITAKATKEVILSAGSINTPQLLMLSGIGPQDHLEELGIDIIQNLKVGSNLQDHVLLRGIIVSVNHKTPPTNSIEDIFQFLIQEKGYFAGVNLFNLIVFIKTTKALYPNIEFFFTTFPANSTLILKNALTIIGFNDAIQCSILDINSNKSILLIMPALLRPKSRGKILLRSEDPLHYPLIFPGYFKMEQDIQELLEAITIADKFTKTWSMRNIGAKVEHIDIPGCENFLFQTENYWRCVIRQMSVSVYHPVGTCQMGPQGNPDSVVDPLLRVIGIDNLRVVDASIMPTITSGNTNAPTIAIGEKGADIIKDFWKIR